MLNRLAITDFTPLLGQVCELYLPDGGTLPLTVLSMAEAPRARMPGAPEGERMPFSVVLRSLQGSEFAGGCCGMVLGGGERVDGMHLGRIMGSDPALAYFQIVFN